MGTRWRRRSMSRIHYDDIVRYGSVAAFTRYRVHVSIQRRIPPYLSRCLNTSTAHQVARWGYFSWWIVLFIRRDDDRQKTTTKKKWGKRERQVDEYIKRQEPRNFIVVGSDIQLIVNVSLPTPTESTNKTEPNPYIPEAHGSIGRWSNFSILSNPPLEQVPCLILLSPTVLLELVLVTCELHPPPISTVCFIRTYRLIPLIGYSSLVFFQAVSWHHAWDVYSAPKHDPLFPHLSIVFYTNSAVAVVVVVGGATASSSSLSLSAGQSIPTSRENVVKGISTFSFPVIQYIQQWCMYPSTVCWIILTCLWR